MWILYLMCLIISCALISILGAMNGNAQIGNGIAALLIAGLLLWLILLPAKLLLRIVEKYIKWRTTSKK